MARKIDMFKPFESLRKYIQSIKREVENAI
jgi:hypothetical protein